MAQFSRKIKSFTSLPRLTRWLFAEAVFTAAYVKITLLFLPFRKVAGWLGTRQVHAAENDSTDNIDLVKKIRQAVKLCDKYTPWDTECYTRSLTAKIMLRRRKVPSTLYFGFCKDEHNRLKGHAWLQSAGITVTGFCDFSQYQVHSSFS